MNIDSFISRMLKEEKPSGFAMDKYKLYNDLNDLLLKTILHKVKIDSETVAKENIETVNYVLQKHHRDIYNDLSAHEVEIVKNMFKNDFIEKKNTEYALGGFDKFIEHYRNVNKRGYYRK